MISWPPHPSPVRTTAMQKRPPGTTALKSQRERAPSATTSTSSTIGLAWRATTARFSASTP